MFYETGSKTGTAGTPKLVGTLAGKIVLTPG
jgi:hypothetical protein